MLQQNITTRWDHARRLTVGGALAVAGLWLTGCAGHDHVPTEVPWVFPPQRMQPISVAVTEPLQPMDLGPAHASLTDWSDSGAQRRQLMACTWQTGADGLAELAVPGTDLACFAFTHSPLPPVSSWLQADLDSLGRTTFTMIKSGPLSQARYRGWSHLVVPLSLDYGPADEQTTDLILTSTVAIVDVLEAQVVWQGEVDGRGRLDAVWFDQTDGQNPPLTHYEKATYAWLLGLFDVMDRMRREPDAERPALSLLCHEPPPVFSYDDSAEAEADPTVR